MVILGLLCMLASAGAGGYVCWENRNTLVQIRLGDQVWTGHLVGVFVLGALFACWFLLGVSLVRLRLRERREGHRPGEPKPDTVVREHRDTDDDTPRDTTQVHADAVPARSVDS